MTEKKWFKIGEMATLVGVTTKELRYWEAVIPEIKPRRSKGNLRYYHADELPRLQRIRGWLREGLTVADCRDLLEKGATAPPPGLVPTLPTGIPFLPAPEDLGTDTDLGSLRVALQGLLDRLAAPPPDAPAAAPAPPKPRKRKPLPPPPDMTPLLLPED